jgi:tRNA threonylcarbamoyladenosine biosynthesis protein TsaB
MKVLALETATENTGIAVVGEDVFAEFIIGNSREGGNRLVMVIDRTLKDVNLELKDIDLLAVGIGPGFYTGLRVGMSIMKGFAIAAEKPLVGISTLDTIAYNFLSYRERVVTLLNAYGGETYGAIYETGANLKRRGNYFVGDIATLLKNIKGRTIFAGTGIKTCQKKIEEILGENALFSSEDKWIPHPVSLGKLAIRRFKKGHLPHLDNVLPLYLKKSEAERKWESSRFRQ